SLGFLEFGKNGRLRSRHRQHALASLLRRRHLGFGLVSYRFKHYILASSGVLGIEQTRPFCKGQ
ncbi:MAG: hypothetical protein SGI86_16525, partial [Deltaproteobacteria bacterium]|nr:hypothetical protein [Deltaproteobacteria bacterium]